MLKQQNVIKIRAKCLEESIKRPDVALEYFKNEYVLGHFNNNHHPIIGCTNLFIKDILKVWELKDMGTNSVVKYLNKTILKPFSYASHPMLHQLFKQKISSPEEKFIRAASSINHKTRMLAEKSLINKNSFIHSKDTIELQSIATTINQAKGRGTWEVRDLGENPIASQIHSLAKSFSEQEIHHDDILLIR